MTQPSPRRRGGILASILLLSLAASSCRAACPPRTTRDASPPRFVAQGGEVRDRQTGLIWQRCSTGSRWNGKTCQGRPQLMVLDDARVYARKLGHGWRLPSIQELGSLLDRRCGRPALDAALFPGVVELYDNNAKYWSDTPVPGMPPLIYNIDFLNGEADGNTPRLPMGLRLARSGR